MIGLLCLGLSLLHPQAVRTHPPNFLFIAIDDLNDWVGCLGGHPQVKTPNIDAWPRRGTLFTNAPLPGAAVQPVADEPADRPAALDDRRLRAAPVVSATCRAAEGIASRCRSISGRAATATFSDGQDLSRRLARQPRTARRSSTTGATTGEPRCCRRRSSSTPRTRSRLMDWGVFPERDEDQDDWKIADAADRAAASSRRRTSRSSSRVGFRLPARAVLRVAEVVRPLPGRRRSSCRR